MILPEALQNDLPQRWQKIRTTLFTESTDACLISTNVNLLYTSGLLFSGYVYLTPDSIHYFVRRPVGLQGENVHYIRKPEQIPEWLHKLSLPFPKRLFLEADEMPHSDWQRLSDLFPYIRYENATTAIRWARSIKTPYEIAQLRESAHRQAEAYRHFPSVYKPGMTDQEFTVEVEYLLRKAGNLGLVRIFGSSMEVYGGSVLAGDNALAPSPYDFALGGRGLHPSIPVGQNGTRLEPGHTLMVDMAGNFNGYISDLTRVYSVGPIPDEALRAHQVALEIQHYIATAAVPGMVCEDIYDQSVAIAKQHGLAHSFMGSAQQAKFVAHGVGLVLNELPVLAARSQEVLQEGMCLAVEPKFVVPGVGAVGIENTFVVTANGLEKLTLCDENIIDLLG